MRLTYVNEGTYACKEELCGDQRLPLIGICVGHDFGGNSTDQLTDTKHELIGSDCHSSDLEGSDFRDISDQGTLSETDTESNEDRSSKPSLPVVWSDLGDRASKQDHDGNDHGTPANVSFYHLVVHFATHFRPSRSIARAPANIPRVLEISANPCQYEMTLALMAGTPLSVISAICLTKGSIGMTLPGIYMEVRQVSRNLRSKDYLLLELYLVSDESSILVCLTYTIVEGSPIEDTAKDDTSPKCLENIFST
jgi:hypothetical protein